MNRIEEHKGYHVETKISESALNEVSEKMTSWQVIIILIFIFVFTINFSYILAFFLVLAYIGLYVTTVRDLKNRIFLKKYAESNGLQLLSLTREEDIGLQLLSLAQQKYYTDNSKKLIFIEPGASFVFDNYKDFPIRLFCSNTLSQHNEKKIETCIITQTTIPGAVFPSIIILNKDYNTYQNNNSFFNNRDVRMINIGSQGSEYTLYTINQYEIEALQICTPEFVELIKNSYLSLNFEFLRSSMYISSNLRNISDEKTVYESLTELHRITKVIIEKYGSSLLRMTDDYQAMHEAYKKEK